MNNPKISVVIPCLNEEKALATCLVEIIETIRENKLDAEIILVDNASTDNSLNIAKEFAQHFPRLKVLSEPVRGYGSTYLRGLENARGEYIVMGDADGTYDFRDIPRFVKELEAGADLVIGNRFSGNMHRNSMPWHHKHIGNPFLSFFARILFKTNTSDMLCGIRAITRLTLKSTRPQTIGMEFSAEMIIRAAKKQMVIREIPVIYRVRSGESKLRSFADGWRYMRFILLYSPLALFFVPGTILFVPGVLLLSTMYFFDLQVLGIELVIHPIFLFAIMVIVGFQLIIFAGFAKTYAITHLDEKDELIEKLFKHISIEKAGILGICVILLGAFIYGYILVKWLQSGMGSLDEIKNAVVGLVLMVLGIQTIFSAFMISILGIREK